MNSKVPAILLAAGLLSFSAVACSGPSMTTEETCGKIEEFVLGNMFGGGDEQGLYDGLKPIHDEASKDLKDPLKDILVYLEASAEENADEARLEKLEPAYNAADEELDRICG